MPGRKEHLIENEEEEQRKCFNYQNLQPLWASENLTKGSKDVTLWQPNE